MRPPVNSRAAMSGEWHRPVYGRLDIEVILAVTDLGGDVLLDERGLRVTIAHNRLEPGNEEHRWHPLLELAGQGGEDPLSSPWLPPRFSAGQLAAFMLSGLGTLVRDEFGEWADGPDEDKLAALDPLAHSAREALREAFAAYRAAESWVGRLDTSLFDVAAQARSRYQEAIKQAHEEIEDEAKRRKAAGEPDMGPQEYGGLLDRAAASVEHLSTAEKAAQRQAEAHAREWRRRMVHALWSPASKAAVKPPPKQSFQDQEVLRVLRELRYDPKALPRAHRTDSTVKAAARRQLRFTNAVFDLSWRRLRKAKEVRYADES